MELTRPAPFRPALWARGPHAQTILSHLIPTSWPELSWTPERLALEPGEALHLEVAEGRSDTVVVLFHGLGGHAGSSYVRRSAGLAAARGHHVICANHRGAGRGRGLASKPYHCGSSADVAAVISYARRRFPDCRVVTVGFSLSAAMLVLLLGRDAHLEQPDAALAVNPPGDLEACSLRLQRGLNRLYDRRFLRLLTEHVRGLPEPPALPPMTSLRDFDEAYTAPRAGFRNRADYYARCSCGPHLAAVRTPLVLLSSADDPFAPASDLGPPSASVHLHLEPSGGHCGYLGAAPGGSFRWLDYAVDHYLAELTAAHGRVPEPAGT